MLDFVSIRMKEEKSGTFTVYPDWIVDGSVKDLAVNDGSFQAVWDEEAGLWSTSEYTVQRLVDAELRAFSDKGNGVIGEVKYLRSATSKAWSSFQQFLRDLPENRKDLDGHLVFANTEVKKEDYATKRLPYALEEGTIDAWSELVGTLYSPEERAKLEWAIGAVVSGDSTWIQKFIVLYGKPGSGKSTILNVIEKLFEGYTTVFNAKELTSNGNSFSTAPFAQNPLVGVQQDGDLSRIEDNTQLNMITAHDNIIINGKYAKPYTIKSKAFLFMGTNDPVKIKNAKAGIMRRLIDVEPSGNHVEVRRYHQLVEQIDFELGAIASHCKKLYLEMGSGYYADYSPRKMQYETDVFYNFVEANHDIFSKQDGVSLKQAWEMYKEYNTDSETKGMPRHRFRSELSNYFNDFHERMMIGGEQMRSYFTGYKSIFAVNRGNPVVGPYTIELDGETSIFDDLYDQQPAQYAKESGYPGKKWQTVDTILKDLDTSKLHYVRVPEQHIVLDFDLVDEDGEKDLGKNLEEAAKFPPTYTELSKSGAGVHLHYVYAGDVRELSSVYDVGIEVKTLLGDGALRRKLTKCNKLEIATISSGLPIKEKKMLDVKSIKTEQGLRNLVERNIRKEIHPGTKPSVDFIAKVLEDAFEEGLSYDVRDMRPKILAFAAKSSNQASTCIRTVQSMRFVGKGNMPPVEDIENAPIIFFDVEVYPNLFVVCWKVRGSDEVVRMINPTGHELETLLTQKLVGFNNRRYDNHIVYARYIGHSLEDLYRRSQGLINNNISAGIGEAYNLSYADIYDFSSKKQGLKKFEIELGILHMELDIPWDQPVPEELWPKVVEYCVNDVNATEAVFESRYQDFVARQILADISGLSVNHTTQQHTAKILFGDNKAPQNEFIYTDLSEQFPGYSFNGKESTYREETVGEGGYVYAEPGIYSNVALLDVASMHPTSIEELNLFGPYTGNFSALKEARLAIKRQDYEGARGLLDGKLAKYLEGAEEDSGAASDLSYALKIVINIVYGLTSAKFENAFRDNRNKDNIVAKRGALFMIDLKHAVQEKGYIVAHIKTDSIKIPIPSDSPKGGQEIIDFVMAYGKTWGYDFEHEGTYEKFCLVNDAVYVAYENGNWKAVGAQFQHPYVFKTLFQKGEGIEFQDFCEHKSVLQGAMYLDTSGTGEFDQMVHVGRTGSFVPVTEGGGELWRIKEEKKYAVTGTKGYKWITRDVAEKRLADDDLFIDMDYFDNLTQKATDAISAFGSLGQFIQ